MDLISHNSDGESFNLAYPKIIAAETSQKNNLHLGKATKADDIDNFMKAMGKKLMVLPQKMFGKYLQNHRFQLQHP